MLHYHNLNWETNKSNKIQQSAGSKKQKNNAGIPSIHVQKNHKAAKTRDSNNIVLPKTTGASYRHSIKNIQSSKDLLKFLEVESDWRNSFTEVIHKPLLKHCDKLQWSMMEKFLKKQIKLVSKSEMSGDLVLQEKLLKRVRKHIKSLVS